MKIREIGELLLGNFPPETRGIPDGFDYPGRNASVVAAMNGAMQELYGDGSVWLRREERGYLVREPATIQLTVTKGSSAAVSSSGWESWMAGCTVSITEADYDNRFLNADSTALRLMVEHSGPSGTVSATVWHDAVDIENDVMEVVRPVRFERQHLLPIPDEKLSPFLRHDQDYDFHRRSVVYNHESRAKHAQGRPVSYAVETWDPGSTEPPRTRLMLAPFPDRSGMLDLTTKLRPPVITDMTSEDTLPIPHGFEQSLFLPICQQRLKASPFYRSDPAKDREIERAYGEARRMLSSLNPRTNAGRNLVTPY